MKNENKVPKIKNIQEIKDLLYHYQRYYQDTKFKGQKYSKFQSKPVKEKKKTRKPHKNPLENRRRDLPEMPSDPWRYLQEPFTDSF